METQSSNPLLLTPTEAALELRLGRSTVYELLRDGTLRSVTIGRSRRIPRAALDDFVANLVAAGKVA